MAFSQSEIKKCNKTILVDSLVLAISWATFIIFFVVSSILLYQNHQHLLLIKIIDIVLAVLASWITIFILTASLIKTISKKNAIKRIVSYEDVCLKGKLVKFDVIRTVEKHIEAREIEVISGDDNYLFFADLDFDISNFEINCNVIIYAKYNFLIRMDKDEEGI